MLTAAGASALVAGPATTATSTRATWERTDIMDMQVPELVRVRALKGFRAQVNGVFSIVNPGDVVTVAKAVAVDLRQSNKAVMTTDPENIQKNYLPERKRPKAVEKAAKVSA